jgi:hypothetical protein
MWGARIECADPVVRSDRTKGHRTTQATYKIIDFGVPHHPDDHL